MIPLIPPSLGTQHLLKKLANSNNFFSELVITILLPPPLTPPNLGKINPLFIPPVININYYVTPADF
jgi:hypothetical protein